MWLISIILKMLRRLYLDLGMSEKERAKGQNNLSWLVLMLVLLQHYYRMCPDTFVLSKSRFFFFKEKRVVHYFSYDLN